MVDDAAVPEYCCANAITSFASQLINMGKWEWAIYVLVSLPKWQGQPDNRAAIVKDLVYRFAPTMTRQQETDLVEHLKVRREDERGGLTSQLSA